MTTAIKFEKLEWGNWFSYGDSNYIDLENNTLTQISGKNGSGKSSIPMILEEVLYGKNCKGIKKTDLINRISKSKDAYATLYFTQGNNKYELTLKRSKGSATVKINLTENGDDISSHTSTGTYKTLENILGLDYKVFSQLIYQSSKSSLQFLQATDTQRKEFLILLFGLEKYTQYFDTFKKSYRDISKEVDETNGSIKTINSWINNHKGSLDTRELLEVPEVPADSIEKILDIKTKLDGAEQKNKKILANNEYKTILKSLDYNIIHSPVPEPEGNIQNLNSEKGQLQAEIKNTEAILSKISKLSNKCPTCMQDIDPEFKKTLQEEYQSLKTMASLNLDKLETSIKDYNNKLKDHNKSKKIVEEFERLMNYIDNTLPSDIYDVEELQKEYNQLSTEVKNIQKSIELATKTNEDIKVHNSKVELMREQKTRYEELLVSKSLELEDLKRIQNSIDILKKVFGTSGLINYKIEYLVQDLEKSINSYLSELSSGRFQLKFALVGEKINIAIIDNGVEITVDALSEGELSRVNISTLLAIRKLMAHISNTHINILFLDEIMGVLDDEGKDKLISVLSEEKELNTFLVSHEWEHPLVPKINIVKEKGISRIEVDNG